MSLSVRKAARPSCTTLLRLNGAAIAVDSLLAEALLAVKLQVWYNVGCQPTLHMEDLMMRFPLGNVSKAMALSKAAKEDVLHEVPAERSVKILEAIADFARDEGPRINERLIGAVSRHGMIESMN